MKSNKHESVGGWRAVSVAWRPFAVCVLFALGAISGGCGEDTALPSDTNDEDTPSAEVTDTIADTRDTLDVGEDADILYPGNLCEEDEQCATGLCYGNATSQGFFEPAKCQAKCLDLFNYNRYCNSNADCCKGKCCIGCGSQEGLCILE
jgi:hypothetical protein